MTVAAVVFDLDGTLLDTLVDLAASMNTVLQAHGFDPHPLATYRGFIGNGIAPLVRRALPPHARHPPLLDDCVAQMSRIYADRWRHSTRPFCGIETVLERLTAARLPLGILSNKPHPFTRRMVAALLSRWPFAAVWGAGERFAKKPAPEGALAMAAELGVSPSEVCFVGDSSIDMQTAVSAGMHPAGVLWGFGTAAELLAAGAGALFRTPLDLARWCPGAGNRGASFDGATA